jgi:hypothetical protein
MMKGLIFEILFNRRILLSKESCLESDSYITPCVKCVHGSASSAGFLTSLPWREGLREGGKMAVTFVLVINPSVSDIRMFIKT